MSLFKLLTSNDRSPQVKRRCVGLAAFEPHPRYSYKLVDVYIHLGTFWKDDSRGTLPQVTTFKNISKHFTQYPSNALVDDKELPQMSIQSASEIMNHSEITS